MNNTLNRKALLVVGAGALVIGFFAGLNAGSIFPSLQVGGGLSRNQIQKIRAFFPVVLDVRSFSGTIKGLDDKGIFLEIAESTNPLDEWPTTRRVMISDNTKIVKTSQKTAKEFKAEMEAYSPILGGDPTKPPEHSMPPSLIKEEMINLSDLKNGDMVTVEADYNIKNEVDFIAARISISLSAQLPSGVSNTNFPVNPPAPAP